MQQFGLTPKYEEVAREGSGSGRVHVQVGWSAAWQVCAGWPAAHARGSSRRASSHRAAVQVSAQEVVLGESVMVATNFKAGCRLAAEAAVEGWAANEGRVRSAREAAAAAAAQAVAAA